MNKGIDWEKHEPLISEECPDAILFTYAISLIFRGWDAVILSHVLQKKPFHECLIVEIHITSIYKLQGNGIFKILYLAPSVFRIFALFLARSY